MAHKFGIHQSTVTSCIFYKQDEDRNQSTFNVFVAPITDRDEKEIFAFIDNEQIKRENWFGTKDVAVKDIFEAFGEWASGAPFVFELEAHKSLGHCLRSVMKIKED